MTSVIDKKDSNLDKENLDEKKERIRKIREKAKELEEKGILEEKKEVSIKEEVSQKEESELKKDMLVPIEDYLKASIYLGTRVVTPDMKKYVYRRRADGIAVFNTSLLDEKIKEGAEFIAKYNPEDIIVVCKREAGWKAVNKFSEITGIRAFTKKYPAGILTNTKLEDFFECGLVIICDPWVDKNALNDAKKINAIVVSICDTNNYTNGIDVIIPGNNKSAKSLGMIFYLITKIYIEKRKLDIKIPQIEEFIEDWASLQPPK